MKRLGSLLSFVVLAACSGGGAPVPQPEELVMVRDFLLEDVNDTSRRFTQDVSPRDYLALTSAWYFGDAT